MEFVFEILLENLDTIILGLFLFLANRFGYPKTAEQITAKFEKKREKAKLKAQKSLTKAQKAIQEIEENQNGGD